MSTLTLGYIAYTDSVAQDLPARHIIWSESYTVCLSVKEGYIDSSADSKALRSDCAAVPVDLEAHCPHIGCDKCDP